MILAIWTKCRMDAVLCCDSSRVVVLLLMDRWWSEAPPPANRLQASGLRNEGVCTRLRPLQSNAIRIWRLSLRLLPRVMQEFCEANFQKLLIGGQDERLSSH